VAKLITKSIFTSPVADETNKMLEQIIRSRLVTMQLRRCMQHLTYYFSIWSCIYTIYAIIPFHSSIFNQAKIIKCILSIIRYHEIKINLKTCICKMNVELRKFVWLFIRLAILHFSWYDPLVRAYKRESEKRRCLKSVTVIMTAILHVATFVSA